MNINLNQNEFSIWKTNKNIEVKGNKYFENKIKTTKYTILNFLPWATFYQLQNISNIYFLILIIVGFIPNVSPINKYTTLVPFLVVFSASLVKEMIEDIFRFKNNLKVNNHKIKIFSNNNFIDSQYKLIKHGDIIELKENDFVPADTIIIGNENNSKEVFIETSSLDGEKSLKPKYFIKEINNHFQKNNNNFSDFDFEFKTSKPNPKINNLNGYLIFNNKKHIITEKQFIPRGTKIKSLNKIYLLVILVGHDTKIMLNTTSKNNKISSLEKNMNYFIIIIFIFQLFLMSLALIFNFISNMFFNRFQFQGFKNQNMVGLAFLNFLTYLILLNTLIPISLIITIQLARIIQGVFIFLDINMHDLKRKLKPKIITVNINEELGQINFILSDKTGTLTMNEMELKFLNIGYNLYDFDNLHDSIINNFDDILKLKLYKKMDFTKSNVSFANKKEKKILEKLSNNFGYDIKYPFKFYSKDNNESIKINNEKEFFKLAIILLLSCHDCFVKIENNELHYNGESPDEIAFLEKLKKLNIKIIQIDQKKIKILFFDEEIYIKKLGIIDFDNERKCMSVVVNFKFNNKNVNFLFIKGADVSIWERTNNNKNLDFLIKIINKTVEFFSIKGLRTLIYGFKVISNNELIDFNNDYEKYNLSKNIKDIYNWEFNINIFGSTAVEDKLVPNLEKTIKNIKKAGIKLWVLTGDKLETAKQIGLSCNILNNIKKLIIIQNEYDLKNFMNLNLKKKNISNKGEYSLIIEGIFLDKLLEKNIKNKFYNLIKNFNSCIFCRVTPIQKASIVELVKLKNNITLAIGDGANDVSMIQKANIGIGIFGNEGTQAVNNSDFGIADFTKLDRLLFNHGRLFYLRISKTIIYFFYKNIVFTLPNFWFSIQSGFTGLNFFEDFLISNYNALITAYPLAIRLLTEQNLINYKIIFQNKKNKFFNYFNFLNKNKYIIIKSKITKFYPFLYDIGIKNKIFNKKIFLIMIFYSMIESYLLYIISVYSFYNYYYDRIILSMTLYSLIVVNINIKWLFKTNFLWIGTFYFIFITSILIYILIFLFYSNIDSFIYFTNNFFLNNLTFYLVLILGILFFLSINFTIKIINENIYPNEIIILQKFLEKNYRNKKKLKKTIENIQKKFKFYSKYFNRY